MKAKKVMALVLCAAMVSGLAATTVMAAPEDQFEGLTANEAYEFPMMVKSFQSTYWEAAMKGMDKAAEELGVTYTAQGPNSESDIADQVNIYYYDGIKYAYGFSFDNDRIINEYLYHWPNGREALVFSREKDQYEFRESIQEQLTLAGRTSENRLYLTSSNEWNCAQTEKAYLWFQQKLRGLITTGVSNETTIDAIRKGGEDKKNVVKEMMLADLGICNVVLSGTKEKPIVSTVHQLTDDNGNQKQYTLQLGQESVGTQRFFSRIGLWMDAMNSGAVLVVDEIEASMHPLLTRHLIEMIQDQTINQNHAQLIFTTHDTGLLDLKLLRRDQIWFAEKDEKSMQTDIYALTEFSPRKEENIAKGYLQGRYGAIPFIGGGI